MRRRARAAEAAGFGAPIRVLFVDDDELVLASAPQRLSRAGFRVTQAAKVEQALDLVRGGGFDVAVVDLVMPYPDPVLKNERAGLLLLEQIKQDPQCSNTEVIILTGKGSQESAAEAMQAGAYTYVDKSLQGDEILPAMIRHAASRRRTYAIHRELWERVKVALSVAAYTEEDLRNPEILRDAISQLRHAASLVELSDLVAQGTGDLALSYTEACSWPELLHSMSDHLESVAGNSGIRLSLLDQAKATIRVDSAGLRSCLTYLVDDVREGVPPGAVTIGSELVQGQLVITILDDSDTPLVGDDQPERPGLAAVEAIIRAHSGSLEYLPAQPGVSGNRITITLPAEAPGSGDGEFA